MSSLREAWESTGARQAALYRIIKQEYGAEAISKSAFDRAMLGKTEPEKRTVTQVQKAVAVMKQRAFLKRTAG